MGGKAKIDPVIADEVPWSDQVSEYDEEHFITYLRLLDAGSQGAHYAFLRKAPPGALFYADLAMRAGNRALAFVPPEYHDDPEAARHSVRTLLDLDFSILCLAHGRPITHNPHQALRRLLERNRD